MPGSALALPGLGAILAEPSGEAAAVQRRLVAPFPRRLRIVGPRRPAHAGAFWGAS
jgi:hypothetical protein